MYNRDLLILKTFIDVRIIYNSNISTYVQSNGDLRYDRSK